MSSLHVAPSATTNGSLEVYGAPPLSVVASEQLRLQPTSSGSDPLEQVIAEEMVDGGCEGGEGGDGGGDGGEGGGGVNGGDGGGEEGGGGGEGGEGGEGGGCGGAAPQLTATSATAASPVQELLVVYSKANDGE